MTSAFMSENTFGLTHYFHFLRKSLDSEIYTNSWGGSIKGRIRTGQTRSRIGPDLKSFLSLNLCGGGLNCSTLMASSVKVNADVHV